MTDPVERRATGSEYYRLTTDLYVDTVMAVCRALKLDKPVVMGCSIGGRAVLHLSLRHGDYFRAAISSVACLISPTSLNAEKWETLWHYMQGGPSVFMGDLHYNFTDGDLRNGLLDALDTKRCPLYLLTGEYDLSATPELTAALARQVKATHFEVMKDMGHFPMSENPQAFRKYLLPVLARIAQT